MEPSVLWVNHHDHSPSEPPTRPRPDPSHRLGRRRCGAPPTARPTETCAQDVGTFSTRPDLPRQGCPPTTPAGHGSSPTRPGRPVAQGLVLTPRRVVPQSRVPRRGVRDGVVVEATPVPCPDPTTPSPPPEDPEITPCGSVSPSQSLDTHD